jgi:hypothetical protein
MALKINNLLHFEDIRMIYKSKSLLLVIKKCLSSIIIDSFEVNIFDGNWRASLNVVTFIDCTCGTSPQKLISTEYVLSYINFTIF